MEGDEAIQADGGHQHGHGAREVRDGFADALHEV
jgi:hypothetical protein